MAYIEANYFLHSLIDNLRVVATCLRTTTISLCHKDK